MPGFKESVFAGFGKVRPDPSARDPLKQHKIYICVLSIFLVGAIMNISMHFEGFPEKIIAEALRQGVVKTKAEALRLGLLELNDKYGLVATNLEENELRQDIAEFDRMDGRIVAGKSKLRRASGIDEIFA